MRSGLSLTKSGWRLLWVFLGMLLLVSQLSGQAGRGQRGRQGDPPDQRGANQQNQAGPRGAAERQNQLWDMIQYGRGGTQVQPARPGILPQSPPARPGLQPAGQPGSVQPNRPGSVPVRPGLGRTGPPPPSDPPSMRMRLEGETLTAEIRNTPLQDVLGELAAWSGIVFAIESQEDPPVSVNFFSVSLTEAVDRLTQQSNSLIYYGQDAAGNSRMRLVRVLSRAPHPNPPVLHYLGTGVVTKRSDDIVDSPEQALAVLTGSNNLLARQKAIEVLVNSKSPAAVQALKAALGDPAIEVKVAALDGLAVLGSREALPQVLAALKSSHPGVRQSAILAVAALGDAANAKELRPLLKDPDPSVAALAEATIQKLTARLP